MRMKKETPTSELQLSKTRQILWRFSRVNKNVDEKRTTFSELFFDLAVVFIFALLASRLMGSIGHSVIQEEVRSSASISLNMELIQTFRGVGLVFWIAHFMALWFTWYQFSNYTKYHWIDNVGNSFLTLMIIFTLILQGAGIYFDNEFLESYSLLISFVSARIIFCTAQYVAISNSPRVDISDELMIKTKRQIAATIFTIVFVAAYATCTELGALTVEQTKVNNSIILNPWRREIFITVIIAVHMSIRFAWKVLGAKVISENSYKIVFHTKERHHLFIIIALGELLVITLTSSFIDQQAPKIDTETILYMFITPFIAIAIWYIYKTIFYKATPTQSKKNYYLYLTTHVFLVLGILVFLGSIKSHMNVEAYLNSNPLPESADDVQFISRTFYSIGVVIGIGMIVLAMTVYSAFVSFEQKRWGKVVKGLTPVLIVQGVLVIIWMTVETILFWLDIPVRFSTVMYTTLAVEIVFAGTLVWRSQKTILKLFDTVEQLDEYSSKLDQ